MNTIQSIGISDHRFRTPLGENDVFYPLALEEASVDLFRLKSEAEERAYEKTDALQQCSDSIAEKCYSFFTSRCYRKGPNVFIHGVRELYLQQIRETIKKEQPLNLVISCMPVKVQHPLKSFATSGAEVDIGDVATLLRMYEIGFGLSRIHPIGAKMKILSDGARYQDVFAYDKKEHVAYRENLQKTIDELGLGYYGTPEKLRH